MADVQSAMAEIRRGEKGKRKKSIEETTGQKYNGLPYSRTFEGNSTARLTFV